MRNEEMFTEIFHRARKIGDKASVSHRLYLE